MLCDHFILQKTMLILATLRLIRHRPPPHPPLKDSCFVIWNKFMIMVTYIF